MAKKTTYRYFIYSHTRECEIVKTVVPKNRCRVTPAYMSLQDDTDLVTTKMVMNFDIIYDANIGNIIYESPAMA